MVLRFLVAAVGSSEFKVLFIIGELDIWLNNIYYRGVARLKLNVGRFIRYPIIVVMEMVGGRRRKDICLARDFFRVFSFLVVAGLAYLIPHWRHLQLALALATLPNLLVLL